MLIMYECVWKMYKFRCYAINKVFIIIIITIIINGEASLSPDQVSIVYQ